MGNWAIILAAGLGVRMGAPKAFLPLGGKPMLLYSLQAFQKSGLIDGIVIVARKEDLEMAQSLSRSASISKLGFVVQGGKERQDSVREGIRALPGGVDVVAIHDAARPLVSVELIDAVVQRTKEKGAALAAVPMKDTVKLAKDSQVVGTLKRNLLWCAQTPQAFLLDQFKPAVEKAYDDNFYGTDCTSVAEHYGLPVYLVEGSPDNLKVTTPSDVLMAEALLKTMYV